MIRYALFALAVAGTAATAFANVEQPKMAAPGEETVTVVYKNDISPLVPAKIKLEKCAVEDCSDTFEG